MILLLILWGIICTLRIKQDCLKSGVPFNPVESSLFNWMGFCFGLITLTVSFIYICISYLP